MEIYNMPIISQPVNHTQFYSRFRTIWIENKLKFVRLKTSMLFIYNGQNF